MPWKVTKAGSQCPASKPWAVVRSDTGKLVACHPTQAKADKHLAALYANEPKAAAGDVPELVTLTGVDIIAAGTWRLSSGPSVITADDLASALDAATCPSVGAPLIKIGHVDPRFDGEPAVGRVENMALSASGSKITADLAGMPAWLGEVIGSAYPNRSMEGLRNFTCQQGHVHPFAITSLALLGVTMPGIGVLNSLDDVAALYGVAAASEPEGSGEKWSLVMGEPLAAGGPTIDDLRKAYMQKAGYQYWITELQLDPLELIVCSEADDQLYRVPVTVGKDGGFTFADPVAVAVSYVDVSQKVAAAAHWDTRDESLAGLGSEIRAAWDAAAQVRNLGDNPSASQLKALFALPGSSKSDSKLPHHTVSADGSVGAADMGGCSAAIAALNGSRGGLKGISDSQKKSAYDHLAAHLRDAGQTPPDLKAAAAGGHDAYSGTHSHPHPAMGSQGGDQMHSHDHAHDGNAAHDHQHTTASATGTKTATGGAKVSATGRKARTSSRNEEGSKVFDEEQMAKLRAELGLDEDAELTGEQVLAAFAALKAKSEGKSEGGPEGDEGKGDKGKTAKLAASARRLPAGAVAIDQGELERLQASAQKGEEALRRIQVGERDQVIEAAVQVGKFAPARRSHYARLWDSDPDGTRELIASLQRNVVPLRDIGQSGGEFGDGDLPEEFRFMFPPDEWAHMKARG